MKVKACDADRYCGRPDFARGQVSLIRRSVNFSNLCLLHDYSLYNLEGRLLAIYN